MIEIGWENQIPKDNAWANSRSKNSRLGQKAPQKKI
jgi:hypothetical protein